MSARRGVHDGSLLCAPTRSVAHERAPGSFLVPILRGDEPIVARKLFLGLRFLGAAAMVGLIGLCLSRLI
jgi:hypothetical protein